jgi:hypothetical protein
MSSRLSRMYTADGLFLPVVEAPLELSFGIANSYLLCCIVLNCFQMTKFLE